MSRHKFHLFCFLAASAGLLRADDEKVVFRSDVTLVRVDVQVLDRDNRAITGLQRSDFVLKEEGRPREIRNFLSEDMPVDLVFLFDVSASMDPHVRRIANAAHQAMNILTEKDRVAIMVFDRNSRLRLPFEGNRSRVERALDDMLRQESFHGGTEITSSIIDAADYVRRSARRDARRAIVIITDDQTGGRRDEEAVNRALERADAVLMALIAPDAMPQYGRRGGYPGGGGGGYPGGGVGGIPGVIFGGPRGGYGGRRGGNYPGGGGSARTQPAGTAEIARNSGGDSLSVDDASALDTTLSRIRQRYGLHFTVPDGARSGQERNINVSLAGSALRRYPDAEVRYRHTYITPEGNYGSASPSDSTAAATNVTSDSDSTQPGDNPGFKRRRMVSDPDSPRGPIGPSSDTSTSSTPPSSAPADQTNSSSPAPAPAATAAPAPTSTDSSQPATGAWRKLKPGEKP